VSHTTGTPPPRVERGVVERIEDVGASEIRELAPDHPRRVQKAAEGGAAMTTKFSPPAEMLSRLDDLRKREPVKFVYAVHSIADRLRELAEKSERMNPALVKLAEKFAASAHVGDLSPFGRGGDLAKPEAVTATPTMQEVLEEIRTAAPQPPSDD